MPNFRTPRLVGKVVKASFALFVLLVNVLILWRVFFSSATPKEIEHLLANDKLCAAYEQYGDELTLRYQEQATITRAEKNYGYFSVTQCVFIPEINQVQIVVRYNNSTIRHLAEDYALPSIPSREETLFDVTLVRTTDLTPEDSTDNTVPERLATKRYYPSEGTLRATTSLYTYYRYVFENVSVEDVTVGVFTDIYYIDDIDYENEAYGTLCLYDDASPWLDYRMTRADKQALTK